MESEPLDGIEKVWRRALPEKENAAGKPLPEKDLEKLALESRLTEALTGLRDSPVPSHFTAQIMTQISRLEQDAPDRGLVGKLDQWMNAAWRGLLPRAFATAAILALGIMGWDQHEIHSARTSLVRSVAQVTASKPMPSLEALVNFDAIQRMSQPVQADKDLLALMQ